MHGTIISHWKIEDGKFHWQVTIPPNTTATVTIPTKDAATVTKGGKAANETAGVRFLRTESQAAAYEVGSGTYDFASPWGVADNARQRFRRVRTPLDCTVRDSFLECFFSR